MKTNIYFYQLAGRDIIVKILVFRAAKEALTDPYCTYNMYLICLLVTLYTL